MTASPKATTSTIIPGLRYADPAAAVDWLCEAFGFSERGVFKDDSGQIVHAQLTFGNGMMMLGPDSNPELKERMALPSAIGGRSTQAVFVVVEDADAHHDMATAAGATILKELKDQEYGGRGYTCADLEGHIW